MRGADPGLCAEEEGAPGASKVEKRQLPAILPEICRQKQKVSEVERQPRGPLTPAGGHSCPRCRLCVWVARPCAVFVATSLS